MTITSSILDVSVPAGALPARLGGFEDVAGLYGDGRPSSISLSRATLASRHLDALLRTYRADDLDYLRTTLAILDPRGVARAILALERLFDAIRVEPQLALRCTDHPCTIEEIVDVAAGPEGASTQQSLDDDDGEGLPYAIAYLKSHAAVLRHAAARGEHVVHGQSHRLDGSEAP